MATAVLKIKAHGEACEVRRARIVPVQSYDEICQAVRHVFPEQRWGKCIMKYPDDEGDLCTLTSATFDDFFHIMSMADQKGALLYRMELTLPCEVEPVAAGTAGIDEAAACSAAMANDAPRLLAETIFSLQSLFVDKKSNKKGQKPPKSANASTDSASDFILRCRTDASTATHAAASTETQTAVRSCPVEASTSTHAAASTETTAARKAVPVEASTATHAAASTETQKSSCSTAVEASTSTHAAASTETQLRSIGMAVEAGTSTHKAASTETADEKPQVDSVTAFFDFGNRKGWWRDFMDSKAYAFEEALKIHHAGGSHDVACNVCDQVMTQGVYHHMSSRWHCKNIQAKLSWQWPPAAIVDDPTRPWVLCVPCSDGATVQYNQLTGGLNIVMPPEPEEQEPMKDAIKCLEKAVLEPDVKSKLCPGGCGFQVTWHKTHCCESCSKHAGKHGKRCEKKSACAEAQQPPTAVDSPVLLQCAEV
mmetsp:Transcript_17941/g.41846  ORF Transcript_17941/g.41846 Transcript_17941/m.41846 type:complete len:481 (-) Transcript_17941:131-1573(-)